MGPNNARDMAEAKSTEQGLVIFTGIVQMHSGSMFAGRVNTSMCDRGLVIVTIDAVPHRYTGEGDTRSLMGGARPELQLIFPTVAVSYIQPAPAKVVAKVNMYLAGRVNTQDTITAALETDISTELPSA